MRHLHPAGWLLVHLGLAALIVAAVAADSGPAPDAVVASWKGGELRVSDWLASYGVKPVPEQRALATPEGRARLLHELERYALLVQEAERRGYGKHVLVADAARNAALEALTTQTLAVAPEAISDAEVAAEYEAKRVRFERPSIRRASLIAVASEAEAKTLLRELRGATREQFGSVARGRSIDPTRQQSGELGWFTQQRRGTEGNPVTVPALVEATFALPRVGALSARPLQLEQGFGVLMLTGEGPPFSTPYEEAAAQIREQLAARRSAQRVEELVAQLRASVKVEVHPELLAPIVLDTKAGLDLPQGFPAHPQDPRVGVRTVKPDKY